MTNRFALNLFVILVIIPMLTACDFLKGVFEAGVWVGVIGVVAFVALLIWLIGKVF